MGNRVAVKAGGLAAAVVLSALVPASASLADVATGPGVIVVVNGERQYADMICETTGAQIYVVSLTDTQAKIYTFKKASKAEPSLKTYAATSDGAAGHVYFALTSKGRPAGQIVQVDAYSTGMLAAVTIAPGKSQPCRIIDGVRFFGFDTRRTVLVTQEDKGGLTYQSKDFATGKGARVSHGRETRDHAGITFAFDVGAVTYEVRQPLLPGPAGVIVSRKGDPVQIEPMTAYFVAPAPPR
jgi:hypothetical protein